MNAFIWRNIISPNSRSAEKSNEQAEHNILHKHKQVYV